MNRLLTCTAIALFLGLTPALAVDNAAPVPGAADTSTGAAQQSSAPQGSKSAMDSNAPCATPGGSMDKSSGAAQQSSSPPCTAAANPSKPNANSSTQ
jgi:hypothetical protein